MSKPNKSNKNNYVQAGRLTPDDMARERTKMRGVEGAKARGDEGARAPTERGAAATLPRRKPRG